MSFFAVLLALVLEQLKALPSHNKVFATVGQWVGFNARHLDAGATHHAWMVWLASAALPALAVALVYKVIWAHSSILALAFNVLVLYFTLGFRQFSHYFTDIRDALERGDEVQARSGLAKWRHVDTADLPRTELLRHAIEFALLAAHRHVFGVFFWFVALSALGLGPMGAVLYRLAEFCARHWGQPQKALQVPEHPQLALLGERLFKAMDHAPARLTAAGFTVVGNFEEAAASWRRDANLWPNTNDGVILASAAGAVGVQLGGAAVGQGAGTGATAGAAAQLAHLHSVVGLVWRSVVLWMLLLALLTMANIWG